MSVADVSTCHHFTHLCVVACGGCVSEQNCSSNPSCTRICRANKYVTLYLKAHGTKMPHFKMQFYFVT